jgi:hypothetical protein
MSINSKNMNSQEFVFYQKWNLCHEKSYTVKWDKIQP